MISFSDMEVSKQIVEHSKKLLLLLENNNSDFLEFLIKENQKIVDDYNLNSLIVHDITPIEIGRFNATIKKVAVGYYGTHDINLNIDIDNSLLYSYTIFHRKLRAKNTWKRNSLEHATTNIFKTEIINQLINLNK